jgi:uncharacterized protein (TIGR00251 family)
MAVASSSIGAADYSRRAAAIRRMMEVVIEGVSGGVNVRVRVIPRAGRSAFAGTRDGALLVRLKAAPVEGAANEELIAVVAKALGVARRDVTIVAGARSRQKRLRIDGVDAATVAARLAEQGA